MKISRASWIILTVGLLVVVFGSLGFARSQQINERTKLEEELTVAEKRLTNLQLKDLSLQKEKLESQVGQVQGEFTRAKDALRKPIASIGVTDSLFELAGASDVTIIEMSASTSANQKVEGVGMAAISLSMTAAGDVANLIDYIARLNTYFTSGIVKAAQISIRHPEQDTAQEGPAEPPTENETPERPLANIQLEIYSYLGD